MVDFIKQKYHTIFGFDTSHKISAQAIDIIYWIIISAAYCFAYQPYGELHWLHALQALR